MTDVYKDGSHEAEVVMEKENHRISSRRTSSTFSASPPAAPVRKPTMTDLEVPDFELPTRVKSGFSVEASTQGDGEYFEGEDYDDDAEDLCGIRFDLARDGISSAHTGSFGYTHDDDMDMSETYVSSMVSDNEDIDKEDNIYQQDADVVPALKRFEHAGRRTRSFSAMPMMGASPLLLSVLEKVAAESAAIGQRKRCDTL